MQSETLGEATLETWSPEVVYAAMAAGEVVLIDVRTPQEYMLEHIEGALLMPMAFFQARALPTQDGKRIVFHCGSGVRSDRVARASIEAGLDPVAHMGGGFAAWKAAKLPFIGTNMGSGAPQRVG